MTTQEVLALLQEGITAAKSGQKSRARELLMRVVEMDDHDEMAWLWLSGMMDEVDDQILCLENALTINPDNRAAERGLRQLQSLRPEPAPPPPEQVEVMDNYQEPGAGWEAAPEPDLPSPPEEAPAPPLPAGTKPPLEAGTKPPLEAGTKPPQEAGSKICVHCGTVNPNWRVLCSLCGKQVDGGAEPVETEVVSPPPSRPEPAPVQMEEEYDTRPQGLLTLGAAWIAAIMFNKRGAYEYEIFSASTGRTITGIVIGGVAIPFLVILLTGLLLALSSTGDTIAVVTALAATPLALVCWGVPTAAGIVIQFYLLATAIYLIAWLLGGKASFVIHTQLLSVAYSAASLLNLTLLVIGGAIFVAVIELTSNPSSPPAEVVGMIGMIGVPLLLVVGGICALAMYGQAISVAHRFSWMGGVGVALLSVLLYGLLAVLLGMVLLALTGFDVADIQSLLPVPPAP